MNSKYPTLFQDYLPTVRHTGFKKWRQFGFEKISKSEQEYRSEHKNGYCPKCHCLLRLNGSCDNCD